MALAASPPPEAVVRCDYGDASTCAIYATLALTHADDQGQSVASEQVVPSQPSRFSSAGVLYVEQSSGQTLALVVMRDATGSVSSIIEISTIGVAQVPTPFVADPAAHPAWYATYGYPSWYAGPRETVPPSQPSPVTLAVVALALGCLLILIRPAVTVLRSRHT